MLCPDSMLLMQLKVVWEEVWKLTKFGSPVAKQPCLVDEEHDKFVPGCIQFISSYIYEVCYIGRPESKDTNTINFFKNSY